MPPPGNRLAGSHSPYLRQHAGNPVHWLPWSDEAWNQARRENKLVLLSIGYSSCHWCHVMERESFEDHEVAHVALDGVEFCRLAAGHVPPEEAAAGQDGDREAIRDVLFAAAALSRM